VYCRRVDAEAAIEQYNQQQIEGRRISVAFADQAAAPSAVIKYATKHMLHLQHRN
jgi:hypothetical protein